MSNRSNRYQYSIGSLVAVVLLSGCAGLPEKPDIYNVNDGKEYSGYRAEPDQSVKPKETKILDDVETLTLAQASEWVLQRNFRIQQSAWEIEKKRALWKQSGLWSNPELEAEMEDLNGSHYKIGLTFPLDLTAKRSRRTRIEAIEFEQIQLDYRQVCRSVFAEVKRCYVDVQTLEMKVLVLEQAKKLAYNTAQLSKNRFQSGAGSKIDLIYAQIDFERASLKADEGLAAYEVKKHKLASLWGMDKSNFKTVEKTDLLPKRLIKEEQLVRFMNQMPIVERARLEKKKQTALKTTAWQDVFEDVALSGNYSTDPKESTGVWGAALGLTVPVFDWKQHQIGAAKISAWQQRLEEKEVALYARQQTRELYRALQGYFKEADLYDQEIVPALKTAYDEAVLFYKSGRLPLIELVRLKNEWLESKVTYQEKVGAFQQALVDVEEAFGKTWNELKEVKQ